MTYKNPQTKYREIHREQRNKESKAYQRENREARNEYAREYRKRNKLAVIRHYSGGTCKCSRCGHSDIRALQIDHTNSGGEAHRRNITQDFYMWLIKNNFPDGFQVLCANCQQVKMWENNERSNCGRKLKGDK